MNNSAHDDISVLDRELVDLIEDEDMRRVFELIAMMEDAENIGSATTVRNVMELSILSGDGKPAYPVVFDLESRYIDGWWGSPLGKKCNAKLELSPYINKEDIEAIKKNNYKAYIEIPTTQHRQIGLSELMERMENYGVSRPSTMSKILSELSSGDPLINIDAQTDSVEITAIGKEAYQILRENLAEVGSSSWNSKICNRLADVEAGKLRPDIVISLVFEDLYGVEARQRIQDIVWTDPDVLYESDDKRSEISGLISKAYNKGT